MSDMSMNSYQNNVFQTGVVEKNKTHILRSVTFFFENLAFGEIMWKNMTA
jgi:DNA-binding ferritin-like protein (Dps family)